MRVQVGQPLAPLWRGRSARPASVPHHQPTATSADVVARIEQLRRQRKYSAGRIATELACEGITISARTVSWHLLQLGLNRRRFLDPTGQNNRQPRQIKIPDSGGWRVHRKGSDHDRQVARGKTRGQRPRYTYLHSAIDGYSRLAYTEALPDEKARTAIGFVHRVRAFFARHGITHIHRLVTDNGACYRAKDFVTVLRGARHQRITPYTPRHNGKVERYNRILTEGFLYAHTWTSEEHRTATLAIWNIHYNDHRPHTAAGNQPPATRLRTGVTNVTASYS